ncbi:hypothetical protein BCR44DRAFT_1429889 [Catenaria anguillulae PL171]|uniref:Uncharacterized protein n=1 Tax=Catenaria anguillulae PL171 TaxID=765915 RepID=A0A1Y2HVH2_9FUNG|nr:hypothetical protein BCR44DRAFT_1429889 [Catenaria anguillulae PL171]
MGGGIRQSWPVYPPASSSSASAASSPAPLLAAHPNASSTSAAAISHPPPPPPSPVTDLAATPATHPLVAAPADHHKRHSLLSVFRTALSAAKWTTRRKSAPPATPVLVTTEPLKLDHHPDPESRPESWVGNRSILPPSVIEYRALDSMEHANLDMDLGMGDDQDSAQAPPASLVAQYPRSEAAAATARSQFVASASSSPPALGDSLLMSGGAGTRAAAGDQASSVLRWLPSADHRLSVSAAQSQVETEGGVGYVGVPMRQNSGGESVSQTPHVTSLSPLVGNAVPGRLEMGDVVTLADVRGGRDAR